MLFRHLGCVVALVSVVLAGCGGDGRLNTKGRIVKGGQPYKVPADEHVRVTFYQLTPNGTTGKNSYIADFNNADGTFRAAGPDGRDSARPLPGLCRAPAQADGFAQGGVQQ
jgi:hypothetical protein